MYCEAAQKLILDSKRTLNLPTLPPYRTEIVRSVTKEVKDLDRSNAQLLAPYSAPSQTQDSHGTQPVKSSFNPGDEPATACALLVNHLCMRRNKRCLLAHHRVRAAKLEQLCWEGAVDMTGNLSPEEEQYVHQYGDMLAAYKGQWTDIDLTGSLEPPRDLFIDVRVLRDAGEIQTEYGSITLTKNSQFYVRLGDVERLIQQGYLQRLSW